MLGDSSFVSWKQIEHAYYNTQIHVTIVAVNILQTTPEKDCYLLYMLEPTFLKISNFEGLIRCMGWLYRNISNPYLVLVTENARNIELYGHVIIWKTTQPMLSDAA